MKVYTEDINQLFKEAIDRFNQTLDNQTKQYNAPYFKEFTTSVNETTKSNLSADTIYKQYFIRLKSYSLPEIGYSLNYLNALCQYVHQKDYTYKYSIAPDDSDTTPEFPYAPYIPCFPATPAIKINLGKEFPEYDNVWIKDESINPLGTHKDRFAWEVYIYYNNLIKEQFDSGTRINLPRISIISSGNAAISIQHLFRQKGLPNLKVIVDTSLKNKDHELYNILEKSGCEIYTEDLHSGVFSSERILKLTNNIGGKELTYGDFIEKKMYYDWLSYEVLNLNPQHLFVPYGSGDLYKNIIDIFLDEVKTKKTSKRFFGDKNILSKCNFLGGTTTGANSKFPMLYSAKNNHTKSNDVTGLSTSGNIGKNSKVYELDNKYFDKASKIAKANNLNFESSGIAGLSLFIQILNEQHNFINPKDKIVIINTGKLKRELLKDLYS